jgi:hypothetical protein
MLRTINQTSFDFRFEVDPASGDQVLILPPDFLAQEDWRLGDKLTWKKVNGGVMISNPQAALRKAK